MLRTVSGPLPPAGREAVHTLLERVAAADGVAPLDESALLALADDDANGTDRHGDNTDADRGRADRPCHLLAFSPPGPAHDSDVTTPRHLDATAPDTTSRHLIGYAQVDRGGAVPTAQVAVDPAARRRGAGRALVARAVDLGDGTLDVWAHGDLPAARALAAATGFVRTHELWRMAIGLRRRPGEAATWPAGFVGRPFAPGQDEAAWLAVNTRAFADHPDQGRWTARDLTLREREPWFDPAGFLLVERVDENAPDGAASDDAGPDTDLVDNANGTGPSGTGPTGIVGFVWTKVHPAGDLAAEPVGEIYVLGVDPSAQGAGLGRALTAAGLDHLAARGLDTAVLWVAGNNDAAIHTYQRAGFARAGIDVRYAHRPTPSGLI